MRYHVYADLSCHLTTQERSTLFEAIDSTIPNSGCVGRQKDPSDEVYFSIEALTENEACVRAEKYMTIVLQKAGLNAEYALTLQSTDRD